MALQGTSEHRDVRSRAAMDGALRGPRQGNTVCLGRGVENEHPDKRERTGMCEVELPWMALYAVPGR